MSSEFRRLGGKVPLEEAGIRIDQYLAQKFLFRTRHQWQKKLRLKEVCVNDMPVKAAYRLKDADEITYFNPIEHEPSVNLQLNVLWEKDGIAGVYKPSNLPMHEGGAYRRNTFSKALMDHMGPTWSAVHRLDRETSGIVLCSKDAATRSDLSAKFRSHEFQKVYLAIVIGHPKTDKWVVDEPIGPSKSEKIRIKNWINYEEGFPSKTVFEVLDRKGPCSLLKVFPKTGRTHQIRIHSAWSGFPLVGDKKYAFSEDVFLRYLSHGFDEEVEAACLFDRLCLHACELSFTHPITNEACKIESPMPQDMLSIWQSLDFHS